VGFLRPFIDDAPAVSMATNRSTGGHRMSWITSIQEGFAEDVLQARSCFG
jgi:hypothetical protein